MAIILDKRSKSYANLVKIKFFIKQFKLIDGK